MMSSSSSTLRSFATRSQLSSGGGHQHQEGNENSSTSSSSSNNRLLVFLPTGRTRTPARTTSSGVLLVDERRRTTILNHFEASGGEGQEDKENEDPYATGPCRSTSGRSDGDRRRSEMNNRRRIRKPLQDITSFYVCRFFVCIQIFVFVCMSPVPVALVLMHVFTCCSNLKKRHLISPQEVLYNKDSSNNMICSYNNQCSKKGIEEEE